MGDNEKVVSTYVRKESDGAQFLVGVTEGGDTKVLDSNIVHQGLYRTVDKEKTFVVKS